MSFEPGQMLAHYRLIEQIGEGGMGVVWKALDTQLDREVAIKILSEELAGDAERVARFEREAKLLASLNHPHIATVHGFFAVGRRALSGDGTGGRRGAGGADRARPPATNDLLEIARQIAEALEAAHEHGVIHRDLKPANVRMTKDGGSRCSTSVWPRRCKPRRIPDRPTLLCRRPSRPPDRPPGSSWARRPT